VSILCTLLPSVHHSCHFVLDIVMVILETMVIVETYQKAVGMKFEYIVMIYVDVSMVVPNSIIMAPLNWQLNWIFSKRQMWMWETLLLYGYAHETFWKYADCYIFMQNILCALLTRLQYLWHLG
jgi:hypothetical protein